MSRNLVKPFFPKAPEEYDQKYMEQVVRSFSVYIEQMQNPGAGRDTGLVLTNLQTDDQGLEIGELFQYRDAAGIMGQVKVTVADQPNLRGNTSTGGVGAVTVVIS
jgi:hypothetical protein|tara:strand:+ start:1228 stop:1542 length:315 start_codon:yes stop_codon:yes gene_type:complete